MLIHVRYCLFSYSKSLVVYIYDSLSKINEVQECSNTRRESLLRDTGTIRSESGEKVGKKPYCVKAASDVADFISSLERSSHLHQIVEKALGVLKEDMFAGQLIEKKKFPKTYVVKYSITNLYKYNLDRSHRLTYTLIADAVGVAVVVLEIMNNKEYEKRFGYH